MSILTFYQELFTNGHVNVTEPHKDNDTDQENDWLWDFFSNWEKEILPELPPNKPSLNKSVVLWAARIFYRCSQAFVFRELDETWIKQIFQEPCPEKMTVDVIYTTDCIFRFFPELIRLMNTLSVGDVLEESILSFLYDWPLSASNGLWQKVYHADTGKQDIKIANCIFESSFLYVRFIDRLAQYPDHDLYYNNMILTDLKEILGNYPQIQPDLADRIAMYESQKEIK